jgi:hypothetical protein
MPRHPARPLSSTLITLLVLTPALATAQPYHEKSVPVAAARPAGPSLVWQLRSLLSVLWADPGSILEPAGAGARTSDTSGGSRHGVRPRSRRPPLSMGLRGRVEIPALSSLDKRKFPS